MANWEYYSEEEDVDHIYKLTAQDDYWINPIADGMLCWEKKMHVSQTRMAR